MNITRKGYGRIDPMLVAFFVFIACAACIGYLAVKQEIEKENRRDAEFLECISKNGTYIRGIRQDLCVKNIIVLEGAKK